MGLYYNLRLMLLLFIDLMREKIFETVQKGEENVWKSCHHFQYNGLPRIIPILIRRRYI